MPKLDLTKSYYNAPQQPETVFYDSVPYLTLAGRGDPSGPLFTSATEALYTFAYGIKSIGKQLGSDFTVAKLEGLW
ncbi:MAG: hypothetical protein K0R28_4407 [Paenibacillus sp.]|jgi:hypothetical protein|nr:hypothetical protein [Paenibacillus sp.]